MAAVFAQDGGDIPWSVYYTEGLSPDDTRPARFSRALARGMDWVNAHAASSFSDFLARTFPKVDPGIAVQVVDTYRACGMWTTPQIGGASYARWQRGIADGHLTDGQISYDALIDDAPTRTMAGSLPA
ncbi:hypothetical protein GGQ68_000510 [Sagittula marina]|uniref:Uncharacterized protein n=1 Tax=Sagittula marina TaxID=943940 RepID=A0A7W6GSK4_9RHOB|nr:hypothetical protein [Sagittula marina]MBB3984199.1 hypothetical protein [Sagittula marina]